MVTTYLESIYFSFLYCFVMFLKSIMFKGSVFVNKSQCVVIDDFLFQLPTNKNQP